MRWSHKQNCCQIPILHILPGSLILKSPFYPPGSTVHDSMIRFVKRCFSYHSTYCTILISNKPKSPCFMGKPTMSMAMFNSTRGYIPLNSGQLSSNFLVVRSCMWSSQSVWIPKTTTTRAAPRHRPRTGIYPHSTLVVPSGKRLHNYGKSQSLIGKSTINGPFSIAMLVITIGYSNCLYFRVLKVPLMGDLLFFFPDCQFIVAEKRQRLLESSPSFPGVVVLVFLVLSSLN